jgi:arsenate reductase
MGNMSEGIRRGRPSMLGSARPRRRPSAGGSPVYHLLPPRPPVLPGRKRVLFVCVGNSCRSQMAEGFAKALGGDLLEVHSAGLSPALFVQPETHEVMAEHGIRLIGQRPKGIEMLAREPFDVVVNMSGQLLPRLQAARVIEWRVRDPIGRSESVYRDVAAQIEQLVRGLISELRERP